MAEYHFAELRKSTVKALVESGNGIGDTIFDDYCDKFGGP